MPGFDRTGPRGEGPRTGRQMGKCAPRENKKAELETGKETSGPDTGTIDSDEFNGRGYGHLRGRGPGRGSARGTGRGMGRGVGRHRRRKGGN